MSFQDGFPSLRPGILVIRWQIPGYAPFASVSEHMSPNRCVEVGFSQPRCGEMGFNLLSPVALYPDYSNLESTFGIHTACYPQAPRNCPLPCHLGYR